MAREAGSPADAILGPTDSAAYAGLGKDGEGRLIGSSSADAFLGALGVREIEAQAASMKERERASELQLAAAASASAETLLPTAVVYDPNASEEAALTNAYMVSVEMQNGRLAMLGFYAAVAIESVTGQGIIGQLFSYGKASGLLGAASGF